MALLEKHLVVKKSSLPNSGKGLFTKVFIPKKTKIVEYKGRITTWKEVKDDDGKNGYIFFISWKRVIDAFPTKQHLARYANDANGYVRIKGVRNNAEYVVEDGRCYIVSTKDIPARGEIFVDYGKDYWKTMRDNLKLEKEKERERKKKEAAKNKKKAGKKKKGSKKAGKKGKKK